MKVTTNTSISFPTLNWGISAGEQRELPEDKDAQAAILACPEITVIEPITKTTKETN